VSKLANRLHGPEEKEFKQYERKKHYNEELHQIVDHLSPQEDCGEIDAGKRITEEAKNQFRMFLSMLSELLLNFTYEDIRAIRRIASSN
jgi:hypothetical protein